MIVSFNFLCIIIGADQLWRIVDPKIPIDPIGSLFLLATCKYSANDIYSSSCDEIEQPTTHPKK